MPAEGGSKPLILLADDDASIRESLGGVLELEGYQVVFAADGAESVRRFKERLFDLVLLDIKMPHRNGWDVFEALTSHNPLVPIVIITGESHQYRTAKFAGAGALMEKPLNIPALLEVIHKLLQETPEERLRRIVGQKKDTRYFKAALSL